MRVSDLEDVCAPYVLYISSSTRVAIVSPVAPMYFFVSQIKMVILAYIVRGSVCCSINMPPMFFYSFPVYCRCANGFSCPLLSLMCCAMLWWSCLPNGFHVGLEERTRSVKISHIDEEESVSGFDADKRRDRYVGRGGERPGKPLPAEKMERRCAMVLGYSGGHVRYL